MGTFLPWLRSGEVNRNSFQASGKLQRLLDLHGIAAAAVALWPFVVLACAVVGALFAFSARRAAAALGLVVGAVAAAVAIGVLASGGAGLVAPTRTGPMVTMIGALIVLAVSVCLLVSRSAAR